jgi:hypothetical protein
MRPNEININSAVENNNLFFGIQTCVIRPKAYQLKEKMGIH